MAIELVFGYGDYVVGATEAVDVDDNHWYGAAIHNDGGGPREPGSLQPDIEVDRDDPNLTILWFKTKEQRNKCLEAMMGISIPYEEHIAKGKIL